MEGGVALPRHIGAEHAHVARGRGDKSHHHGDRGGFAGAVAAEQRRHRPRRQSKADARDRHYLAVDFAQVADLDGCRLAAVVACANLLHESTSTGPAFWRRHNDLGPAVTPIWPTGPVGASRANKAARKASRVPSSNPFSKFASSPPVEHFAEGSESAGKRARCTRRNRTGHTNAPRFDRKSPATAYDRAFA